MIWGRRICALGVIVSLVVSLLLAAWFASRPQFGLLSALGLYCVMVAIGLVIAQAFYELDGWIEQRGRDIGARRIFDGLETGEPGEDFTLYLRPFASTDQIAREVTSFIPVRTSVGGPASYAVATDRNELEGDIERALRPVGPLIALGEPLEHMGAGRVRVADEQWQQAVDMMIRGARLIVLLPSQRAGTSWEVERILTSGALERTIVINPPEIEDDRSGRYDPAAEWSAIREAFDRHGFELPKNSAHGQLLYFHSQKTPQQVKRVSVDLRGGVRQFAREILKGSAAPAAVQ